MHLWQHRFVPILVVVLSLGSIAWSLFGLHVSRPREEVIWLADSQLARQELVLKFLMPETPLTPEAVGKLSGLPLSMPWEILMAKLSKVTATPEKLSDEALFSLLADFEVAYSLPPNLRTTTLGSLLSMLAKRDIPKAAQTSYRLGISFSPIYFEKWLGQDGKAAHAWWMAQAQPVAAASPEERDKAKIRPSMDAAYLLYSLRKLDDAAITDHLKTLTESQRIQAVRATFDITHAKGTAACVEYVLLAKIHAKHLPIADLAVTAATTLNGFRVGEERAMAYWNALAPDPAKTLAICLHAANVQNADAASLSLLERFIGPQMEQLILKHNKGPEFLEHIGKQLDWPVEKLEPLLLALVKSPKLPRQYDAHQLAAKLTLPALKAEADKHLGPSPRRALPTRSKSKTTP